MRVNHISLGRRVFGIELDGKLTLMADYLIDDYFRVVCLTDVFKHNSIKVINTGGTSAQARVRFFNSSSRWSK